MVMRLKPGHGFQVGDSTVSVREVKGQNVTVSVKAPRTTPIKRVT